MKAFRPFSGALCARPEESFDAMTARVEQANQWAVRVGMLALALALGGCSASEVVQNWTPATAAGGVTSPADLPQPNHRRIVGDNIKTILPRIDTLGALEISGARPVDHLKGAVWLTCLKVDAHEKPQLYALFIQGDKIVDSRVGVVIDQCYKETFEPFVLPSPPAPKKAGS
jgi:hypothetical protein